MVRSILDRVVETFIIVSFACWVFSLVTDSAEQSIAASVVSILLSVTGTAIISLQVIFQRRSQRNDPPAT